MPKGEKDRRKDDSTPHEWCRPTECWRQVNRAREAKVYRNWLSLSLLGSRGRGTRLSRRSAVVGNHPCMLGLCHAGLWVDVRVGHPTALIPGHKHVRT